MKKKKITVKKIIILAIFVGIVLNICFEVYLFKVCYPNAIAICKSYVTSQLTEKINNSLLETARDRFENVEIVKIARDSSGKILSITTNPLAVNVISSSVAINVSKHIDNLQGNGIEIPIGSLLHTPLFSNKGPVLRFEIKSLGSAICSINTEFESCGINQSVQRVFLVVKTSLQINIPANICVVDVENNVLLSETIIVGEIPSIYLDN